MAIPSTLADIDADFLSEVLARPVADVSGERIAVGEGFLGELARLTLTYADGAEGPATVIAKIPTSDSGLKPLGVMLNVYDRESRAYDEVIPQLTLRTPRAFYNGAEPADEQYCLILEDVGHLRAGDQHAGGTLEEARAVMVAAAGLHGRWWDRTDGLDWVPPIDSPLNLSLQGMYEQAFPQMVDHLGDMLGVETLAHIEAWIPTCRDMLTAYGEMSRTLVHNDFRFDNMFFDGDELVLIDWQTIGRGDGLGDLCPFLGSNFDSELRRAHETDLLRLYHRTITEMDAGFGDFEDLFTSYRISLNFWLTQWCFGLVSTGDTTARGRQLFERAVVRLADATRQHETWELTGDHSWRPRV